MSTDDVNTAYLNAINNPSSDKRTFNIAGPEDCRLTFKSFQDEISVAMGGEAAVNARDRIGEGPWYNYAGDIIAQNVDDLHEDLPGVAAVITDESARAKLALAHLMDKGFREFAFFAPPSNQYSRKRAQAFVAAVKAEGYQCYEYKPGYRVGRRR